MRLEAAERQAQGIGLSASKSRLGGLTGWLVSRLDGRRRAQPRLAVLERIPLAPRQSLVLVEADGRRLLVATSPEGTPAFYPLDDREAAQIPRTRAGSMRW
jgi:flagellar biogenesis protein FliO